LVPLRPKPNKGREANCGRKKTPGRRMGKKKENLSCSHQRRKLVKITNPVLKMQGRRGEKTITDQGTKEEGGRGGRKIVVPRDREKKPWYQKRGSRYQSCVERPHTKKKKGRRKPGKGNDLLEKEDEMDSGPQAPKKEIKKGSEKQGREDSTSTKKPTGGGVFSKTGGGVFQRKNPTPKRKE